MRSTTRSALLTTLCAAAWLTPSPAFAHITVASGSAFANTSQEVAFSVGHGCDGADTYRVELEIPEGVTSVRPETSGFAQVDVTTDDAGSVTMVSWQKNDADVLPADTQFYKLVVRLKAPDAPFTTLFFPAHQTCRAADGSETVVDWVGLDESDPDVEPAPALHVVPARFPGWNKYTLPVAVDDLGAFFADAEIVWQGSAAYSPSPTTQELISATAGVSALDALGKGQEIWVRY